MINFFKKPQEISYFLLKTKNEKEPSHKTLSISLFQHNEKIFEEITTARIAIKLATSRGKTIPVDSIRKNEEKYCGAVRLKHQLLARKSSAEGAPDVRTRVFVNAGGEMEGEFFTTVGGDYEIWAAVKVFLANFLKCFCVILLHCVFAESYCLVFWLKFMVCLLLNFAVYFWLNVAFFLLNFSVFYCLIFILNFTIFRLNFKSLIKILFLICFLAKLIFRLNLLYCFLAKFY